MQWLVVRDSQTRPYFYLKRFLLEVLKSLRVSRSELLRWVILAVFAIGFALAAGSFMGYMSGIQARRAWRASSGEQSLQEQYTLGIQDLAEGRPEVARQRFEFILKQNSGYPGAAEQLAQAIQSAYSTATPTPPVSTPTPAPTRDLGPVQDLFARVQTLYNNQDWTGVIDSLVELRKADVNYMVARVDGMLYLSLRNRGVTKILNERNLEGGIYDLALAEHFAPLDAEAIASREWARLYLIGSSFWEANPEQAVYFFSQVAAAAPGLTDASGWSATERYRAALIQFGDQLANNGDWCTAQQQYELALSIRSDDALQSTLDHAIEMCTPPTATELPPGETPTITPTPTLAQPTIDSPTPTSTPEWTLTPTPASPGLPTSTPESPTPEPPSPSPTPEPPSPTPELPSATPQPETPPPTNTPEPPLEPAATWTPAPTFMEPFILPGVLRPGRATGRSQ